MAAGLTERTTGRPDLAAPLQRARFPCSQAQRRFWVLDRIDPGNPALNIAVRWRLEGRVPTADLDQAFARIIARHHSLRTFFAVEDGEPVQIVEPFLSFHIPDIDLSALAEEDAYAEAERIAQLEARASFDLSAAPLIRVTQLRVRESVSIVLVTLHRMICDDWSVGILARELGTICAALHAGRTPELPGLAISYGEYSAWQTQSLSAEKRQRDEDYWTRTLQALPHFELRPDRSRPPIQTSNGNVVSLALAPDVIEGLQDLAMRCGCTLFTTSLAALFTLLHRYSGESDIAIGSQIAGRDELEWEAVVGVFTNTIVLRADLSGNPSFEDLLDRVRETLLESLEHPSTPLNRLIELLKPKRDLSRNALFSANFNFQESFIGNQDCGSFRLIDMPSCSGGARHDLNFSMVAGPDGWRAFCEYNSDLFEADTVSRLLGHFANLLRAAATQPEQTLSLMPMLDEAERQALVCDWNPGDVAYPKHLTVPKLFEIQAHRTPEAVAVICGEQSLSYRDLDLASNRLAHELRGRGIGRGSRVGICLARSPDLVVALMAVLKSGGAYVPLDPGYPAARLAHIVEDAQPGVLLTTLALRERLPNSAMTAILLDVEAVAIGRQRDTPLDLSAAPEDLAYVIYTSGSTGRPKGVQIQHRALTNLFWTMRIRPGITAGDTLVSVTTVSFDIAAMDLLMPLIVGARLVVAQEEETVDGDKLLRLLRRHRATVMQATPVTWQILIAAGWHADPPLKILCGGEAMSRNLADQLLLHGTVQPGDALAAATAPAGEVWNMYGPTEATVWASALRVEPGVGPVAIGPPIANTQFYVLDSHGQVVPMGVAGELFIGGDGLALGYLNLAEMTRERFVPDHVSQRPEARLYRTGDLVRMRPQGRIEFLGRSDHQIKLRGFRIELGEIEAVLRAHPGIADCVAVAARDASGELAIHAYVAAGKPEPGQAQAAVTKKLIDSLRSSLRQALPAYMCPAFIAVLEALPRTPNGKIDRGALPMPSATPDVASDPVGAPVSEMERRLALIWRTVLDIPEVGVDANFFEIGGHSLLAVRLLARIDMELGCKLNLATLFRNPTIAGQALLLEQADARAFDFRQVVKLQPNGSRPPLIAINNTGIYYVLSKRLGLDQPFTSLQLFDPSSPQAAPPGTLEDIAAGYVQLIRRVQRDGPYALLGWCVAGTLAFEVARQLTASGQEVSQLILFDTWAPGHLRRLSWSRSLLADYSFRWKLIADDWSRMKWGRSGLVEFLTNRTIVRKLMPGVSPVDGREPVTEGQALSPEQYDQWLLRYLENAADCYEPRPYCGNMTLFRSEQEPAGRFLDPEMGWGPFVEGGIEVVVVEGDHFSIFQEPSVSQLAQRISAGVDATIPQLSAAPATVT